ncbi:MAG: NADH-quinone oxidoreductase subunit J [Fervidicoccaceae archaeon]
MSLLGSIPTLSIYFSIASIVFVSGALAALMIKEKSLVYNAFMLAGIGISVSALIAFLGYQVIAAAQLIVYVGASVMFFIVSLSMMGDQRVKSESIYKPLIISVIAFIVFYFLLTTVMEQLGYEVGPTVITAATLSAFLAEDFTFQLFIISAAFLFTAISAIYIAKRKGDSE